MATEVMMIGILTVINVIMFLVTGAIGVFCNSKFLSSKDNELNHSLYSFLKLYFSSADNMSASSCNLAKYILVAVFLPNNTSKAFFVALIPVSFSNLASASLYTLFGCVKNVSSPLLYVS